MNIGQRGKDLIQELKRSDWLPLYNDEAVRSILSEISTQFEDLEDQVDAAAHAGPDSGNLEEDRSSNRTKKPPMASRPAMILNDSAIKRSKRCLLAYHAYRLNKIKALRWDGSSLSTVRTLLSEAEIDFFSEYDKLISKFNTDTLGDTIDLTSNMQPPEEDLVEVRVVKDGLGTIITEHWGEVSLDLGTTHFLSTGDVEHLIRQGVLQQLDGEETS